MDVAIVTDLHGNQEAVDAVHDDIRSQRIGTIWCLGDFVDYGPDPIECCRWVKDNCSLVVRGNHEAVVCDPVERERWFGIPPNLPPWTSWTIEQFRTGDPSLTTFMTKLPEVVHLPGFVLSHASPADPLWPHLLPPMSNLLGYPPDSEMFRLVMEAFEATEHVALIGHSHCPGVIELEGTRVNYFPAWMVQRGFRIRPGVKLIVNAGSVGQPREHTRQASYAILRDTGMIEFRFVNYDAQATVNKMVKIPELSGPNADRLLV